MRQVKRVNEVSEGVKDAISPSKMKMKSIFHPLLNNRNST